MRRVTGVLVALAATVTLTAGPADAAWVQPYGGCKEASGYVSSSGAEQCRDHGWIIRKRIIVSPRGRVVIQRLPECERTVAHRHCFVPFTHGAAYIVDTYGPHIVRTTRITR